MWTVKEIKPIKKALIENNEYIIFLETTLEDDLLNKISLIFFNSSFGLWYYIFL